MPRISRNEHKEYNQMKIVELRERLVRRGLPHGGKKAALVSRLRENDPAHPFPFMRLPAMIRNKIYRLTATTHRFGRLDRYPKIKERLSNFVHKSNQDTIAQPSLIRCSKLTRSEGLLIFFQDHHFLFDLRRLGSPFQDLFLEDLLPWLDKIGTISCKNIRNITLVCDLSLWDVRAMHEIHAKLSEEATVTYQSPRGSEGLGPMMSMLEVARTFQPRYKGKVSIYEDKQVAMPNKSGRLKSEEGSRSLKFLPGLSWFGEKHEVGMQAKTVEEENTTQVVG